MERGKVWRPLVIGVLVSLMTTTSVYAEISRSETFGAKTAKAPTKTIDAAVITREQEKASKMAVALGGGAGRLQGVQAKVAPYVGRLIAKVSLVGETSVDKEQLKEVLKLKPGTTLTADGFEDDVKSLYETGWFYDIEPVFRSVPEGVQITYNVMENPVFKQLDVEGNSKISTAKIKDIMGLSAGKVLNTKRVNEGVRKVESAYSKEGYILARANDVKMLPDGHLLLSVNEGIVEDFKIKGNTKTKDYVIIREMKLKKGQPFNAKAARRSMQRIYNLGFFEDVNIKLNPGQKANSVEVEITVVEMSTGTFGIGAGYSDADGFIGMITIGDKNFRGTGDKINLRWEFGGFGGNSHNNKNYEISYTKPWIDRRETTAGITFYDMTNEYVDYNREGDEIARYDKKRRGQELFFSRVTDNDFIKNFLTLKNRDDVYVEPIKGYSRQYFEASDVPYDVIGTRARVAAERKKENFGTTRSVTFSRVLDNRDNLYEPHEGKRTSYSLEVASFGGDFNFQKFTADYRYYYRSRVKNVLAFNWAIGYANGDMPLSQRFSVGGSETLRGFRDNQFRGNSMLRASLEYRMPIIKKVQGVLFTDAGYAWSKQPEYDEKDFALGDMKYSIGLGLRVNSPLGPIRVDYGVPLRGGSGSRFHFSFGGQF